MGCGHATWLLGSPHARHHQEREEHDK
jgi:hypothetical protein